MARGSSSARRSWRDRSEAEQAKSSSADKWLLLLAAVILVGVLVWLFWPDSTTRTHFVALQVAEYTVPFVPPLGYLSEDREALFEVHGGGTREHLKEEQNSTMIYRLTGSMAKGDTADDDVLVVYVAGQGASRDGKAYLLCSDFDPLSSVGRYDIPALLKEIQDHGAERKVLLLDWGGLRYDPRLGMLANEFAQLLERDVRALPPGPFWVLASHWSLESSHISRAARRSLFGHSVVQSLEGAADVPHEGAVDGTISLAELYDTVYARVSGWSRHHTTRSQTPVLLKAGEGIVSERPDDVLVLVRRDKGEEPAADGEPAEESDEGEGAPEGEGGDAEQAEARVPALAGGLVAYPSEAARLWALLVQADASDDEAGKEADGGKEDGKDAGEDEESSKDGADGDEAEAGKENDDEPQEGEPDEGETSETTGEPDATSPPTADDAAAGGVQTPLASIERAWQHRDALAVRDPSRRWTPVDFAPHLWRELEALLVGYQEQARGGAAYAGRGLAGNVQQVIDGLAALDAAMKRPRQSTPPPGIAPITEQLIRAWSSFSNGRSVLRSGAASDESNSSAELEQALALYNDLVYASVDYVRWHGTLAVGADKPNAVTSVVEKLLDFLNDEGRELEKLLEKGVGDTRSTDLVQLLGRLLKERNELDDLVRMQARDLARKIDTAGHAWRADALLATPLGDAATRAQLIEALGQAPDFPNETPDGAPTPGVAGKVSNAQWRVLSDQVKLEAALLELAGCEEEAEGLLRDSGPLSVTPVDAAKGWEQVRAIGEALVAFHGAQLPKEVTDAAAGDATARLQRLLSVVDARDAKRVTPDVSRRLYRRWKLDRRAPQMLVKAEGGLSLVEKEWSSLTVDVSVQGAQPRGFNVRVRYDDALVEVQRNDGRPVEDGEQVPISFDGATRRAVDFRVRPREFSSTTDLRFDVQDAAAALANVEHHVRLSLPKPAVVDLVIERMEATGWEAVEATATNAGYVLAPLPNHPGTYRMLLVNRSGRPKKVEVELRHVPKRTTGRRGRLFDSRGRLLAGTVKRTFDASGNPMPRAKVFAQLAGPVELSSSESEQKLLELMPPGAVPAPTEEADKPKSAEETEGEEPKEEEPPLYLTDGLVCVIQDTEDPDARWEKWIAFELPAPRHVVDAELSFDASNRKISVQLDASHMKNRLLEEEQKEGINVSLGFDTERGVTITRGQARLAPPNYTGLLEAVVEPDTPPLGVHLSVDGYPRAMVFDGLRTQFSQESVPRSETLRRIRITSPVDETSIAPSDNIRVNLEVDIPDAGFADDEDRIELGVQADGRTTSIELFAHRDVRVAYRELVEGMLTVDTFAGDLEGVELSTLGLSNCEAYVFARHPEWLRKNDNAPHVKVIFDGRPPEIKNLRPQERRVVEQPKMLELAIEAADYSPGSGMDRVEFGIDGNDNGKLDEDEVQPAIKSRASRGGWDISMKSEDLEPGEYDLLVQAVDLVGRTDLRTVKVRVMKARPKPPPATKGTFQVVLQFGGKPVTQAKLDIEAAGVSATSKNGRFTIKDVPFGTHEVVAEGIGLNKVRRTNDEPKPKVRFDAAGTKKPIVITLQ